MTDEMTSASCLMSQVGAGSSAQCFAGDALSRRCISSSVTGLNVDSRSASVRASIAGGGATAVAERIELTFSVKYAAKSLAERQTDDAGVGGLRSTLVLVQRDLESSLHDEMTVDQ